MTLAPSDPPAETTHERLLALNVEQKAYYESRFDAGGGPEQAASTATNLWTRLRRRIQRYDAQIGVNDTIADKHREWLGDLSDSRVLDLGCFAGNPLSIWLAEHAREYVGVDLSEQATALLNRRLAERGLDHATAMAVDILDPRLDLGTFDVVYARSVLHHFEDPAVIAARLAALLRPGGIVIGLDPMQTDPVNALARRAYRPFQSDRDWEWPLTGAYFDTFEGDFELDAVQGYRGFSKLGLPLAVLPLLSRLGAAIGRAGWALDRRFATRRGLALWLCWNVTYRLVRRG